MMKTLITAAALAVGAVMFAPTANANKYGEDQYVAELTKEGIKGSRAGLLQVGYAVCADLKAGVPPPDEVTRLQQVQHYLSPVQALDLATLASTYLCVSPADCASLTADNGGQPLQQCVKDN